MRKVFAASTVVLLLLGSAPASGGESESKEQVELALQCFPKAWNSRDMVAFGQCFMPEADFVNVTTNWWKGQAAIQKNHAYMLGTVEASDRADISVPPAAHGIFKNTTLVFQTVGLRFLRPDVSLARVAWVITGDARTPEPRTGRMLLVITKEGAEWRITAVQNTETARRVPSDPAGSR
jgi:ketosteroid isomerase-like protein